MGRKKVNQPEHIEGKDILKVIIKVLQHMMLKLGAKI